MAQFVGRPVSDRKAAGFLTDNASLSGPNELLARILALWVFANFLPKISEDPQVKVLADIVEDLKRKKKKSYHQSTDLRHCAIVLHRKPDPASQCFLSIDALRLLDDIAKQAIAVAQPE